MLEVIATCLLAAGVTWTIPVGWTAERVGAAGLLDTCTMSAAGQLGTCHSIVVFPIPMTYVTIRRPIALGESVTPPPTCTLEVRAAP